MKRPALYVGIPFVVGLIIAALIVRQLWAIACGGVTLIAGGILLWRRELWKYVLLSTLSCLTACCVYWCADYQAEKLLQSVPSGECTYTGKVINTSKSDSNWAVYTLDGTFENEVKAKVTVSLEYLKFSYGDILTISGTPTQTQGNYLYNGDYYRSEGIFLTFGFDAELKDYHTPEKPDLKTIIRKWRSTMTERIHKYMEKETASMLTGMLFGDKSGFSGMSKNALYRMGIGHIMAVSGLHLDFLAVCVAWLLNRLNADRKVKFGVLAILCILFVICAGETISVKRACIMVLLGQSAGLFFRQPDGVTSLSIAMLILGISNPFVIHSASFWLSCSGAMGIGILSPYMTKDLKRNTALQKIVVNLISGGWVFLAVLPASAIYFNEISLISPLSNLILTPFCMVAMGLGTVAILLGAQGKLAQWLLLSAEVVEKWVLAIAKKVSGLSWTHTGTGSEELLFLILLGIFMIVLCHLIARNKILTSVTALTAVILTTTIPAIRQSYQYEDLRIAVLGSNQNCIVILTNGDNSIIFDMSATSQGALYANAYLSKESAQTADEIDLSHPTRMNLQRYEQYFPSSEITLLTETALFSEYRKLSHKELLFHGAKVTADPERLLIEYGGIEYLCTKESQLQEDDTPEILTIFGYNKKPLPECGIMAILDENSPYIADNHTYIGENNLEITIKSNGKSRVRRLYASS